MRASDIVDFVCSWSFSRIESPSGNISILRNVPATYRFEVCACDLFQIRALSSAQQPHMKSSLMEMSATLKNYEKAKLIFAEYEFLCQMLAVFIRHR